MEPAEGDGIVIARLKRFWFWLWTGHDSLEVMRRRLEVDCARFGGRVEWNK